MNISIRVLTPGDLDIADSIIRSAFGFSDSRAREIRRYISLECNRWFLATYRDQPAGVLGATNYGLFTYLGMMTVRKELQSTIHPGAWPDTCLLRSDGWAPGRPPHGCIRKPYSYIIL